MNIFSFIFHLLSDDPSLLRSPILVRIPRYSCTERFYTNNQLDFGKLICCLENDTEVLKPLTNETISFVWVPNYNIGWRIYSITSVVGRQFPQSQFLHSISRTVPRTRASKKTRRVWHKDSCLSSFMHGEDLPTKALELAPRWIFMT